MARPDHPPPTQLDRDLVELKLLEIAQGYREVLDEAARKGSSMLEVLATLIGMEQTVPKFSFSMSWAICPSTSAGPTCCSR